MDQFKVIFAPQAERDLKSIAFRIARYSSAEIAQDFGNRLIDRALTLATLPERGESFPNSENQTFAKSSSRAIALFIASARVAWKSFVSGTPRAAPPKLIRTNFRCEVRQT